MITREQLLQQKDVLRDKAVGCMCGLAIGDSLGDAARMPENNKGYGITMDFNDQAAWSTDDTEFSVLTARLLIDTQGRPGIKDVTAAWMRHVALQDDLNRGGNSEISAARNLNRGILPPFSGQYSTFRLSDGSAMRIAPVGVVYAGLPAEAAKYAEIDACISHYADGVWGAQAVAAAVSVAMVNGTMAEIVRAGMETMPRDSWLYANTAAALELLDKNDYSVEKCWMPLHELVWASDPATTCEAIPAMFSCLLLGKGDPLRTMLLSCNYGRDADTVGAVCGAILGARFGCAAFAPSWIEKTRYPSGTCLQFTKGVDLVALGEELARVAACR